MRLDCFSSCWCDEHRSTLGHSTNSQFLGQRYHKYKVITPSVARSELHWTFWLNFIYYFICIHVHIVWSSWMQAESCYYLGVVVEPLRNFLSNTTDCIAWSSVLKICGDTKQSKHWVNFMPETPRYKCGKEVLWWI